MKEKIIFIVTIVITVMIAKAVVGLYDDYKLQKKMETGLMDAYHNSVEKRLTEDIIVEDIEVEDIVVEEIIVK